MKKKGTSMITIDSAGAGDIVLIAGLTRPSIGHTIANMEVQTYILCITAFYSSMSGKQI